MTSIAAENGDSGNTKKVREHVNKHGKSISTIIVTSYVNSHPNTDLLEQVILSLNRIKRLSSGPVIIVFDGYKLSKDNKRWKTKRGLITTEQAERYEQYYLEVKKLYRHNNANNNSGQEVQLLKLSKHFGFAMAVREALLVCKTKYAMIVQHDRIFTNTFNDTDKVLCILEKNEHIKYVGFPSVTSQTHHILLRRKYRLNDFSIKCKIDITKPSCIGTDTATEIPIKETSGVHPNDCYEKKQVSDAMSQRELYLQPCIFWYDSNHICHVERYLKIYAPYLKLFDKSVLDWLGDEYNVNKLKLKTGDFIEDKFGQFQRNTLAKLSDKQNEDMYVQLFKTFGSYLLYDVDHGNAKLSDSTRISLSLKKNVCEYSNKELNLPKIYVQHLRGRQYRKSTENSLNKAIFGY